MKTYVLSLKGKKDPDLVPAEDRKLITEQGVQYYQFLVDGSETARYRASDVQGVREVPSGGEQEAGPSKPEGESQRTYPLRRV